MAGSVSTYKVTLQGGEVRQLKARSIKYTEYGVEFTDPPHSQVPKKFVAFVPYGSLLLVEVEK
ncbi:hypothetical protein OH733_05350 [Streptomyces griseus]|uniref:hypothetical protein n=1 Tax=Streptomyces griseus TaxID=1911 RepID=UPI003866BD78|nr:hypothetical protein OH733_05350 [Streptomyces griseus]WTD71182.1 hypothetical protein OH763_31635 [Streptomyces griseus]